MNLIKEAMEEIDQLKSDIADLKGKKKCSSCGVVIEQDALYCSHCGAKCEFIFEEGKTSTSRKQEAEEVVSEAEEVVNEAEEVVSEAEEVVNEAEEVISEVEEVASEAEVVEETTEA